jgi:hypothetical protein
LYIETPTNCQGQNEGRKENLSETLLERPREEALGKTSRARSRQLPSFLFGADPNSLSSSTETALSLSAVAPHLVPLGARPPFWKRGRPSNLHVTLNATCPGPGTQMFPPGKGRRRSGMPPSRSPRRVESFPLRGEPSPSYLQIPSWQFPY